MQNTKNLISPLDVHLQCENADEIIVVKTIADDIWIRSVFRRRMWKVDDGIDFLLGIYSGGVDINGLQYVKTLDGRIFRGPEHESLIDDLFSRHDLMKEIWNHSTTRQSQRPMFFIKWGLKNREICSLSWLDDALAKGLAEDPFSLNGDNEQNKPEEKALTPSEKSSLLQIIAGLTVIAYRMPDHGLKAEIGRDLEKYGLGLSETTRNKHLQAAWDQFLKTAKP